MKGKIAILLATYVLNEIVINRLKGMNGSSRYDFYILYHTQEENALIPEEYVNFIFPFTDKVLRNMGYTPLTKNILPGSNHFGLLSFFKQFSNYSYYWYIEDDVYYNGSWESFFQYFEDNKIEVSFISSYVKDFCEEPLWTWWSAIEYRGANILNTIKSKSFNPIYRISNDALYLLNKKLTQGWMGHHEVVIPTLLKRNGMQIRDFGGTGKYILSGCKNKFYKRDDHNLMNNTMRYRPEIKPEELKEKLLYHPFKIYRR